MNYFTLIAGVKNSKKSSVLGILKPFYPNLGSVIEFPASNSNFKLYNFRINEALELYSSLTITTRLAGYSIKRHLKNARRKGYYIQVFYLASDDAVNHLTPREQRRHENRLSHLKTILLYSDKMVFFDVSEKIQEVGEYHHGAMYKRSALSPKWFLELVDSTAVL